MRAFVLLMTVLLLAACTGVSPKVETYILEDSLLDKGAENAGQELRVVIKSLHFPDYLNRSQMVLRKGASQLEILPFQRWAEPLDKAFLRVLKAGLEHYGIWAYKQGRFRKISSDYQLQLEVTQFEVNSQQQACLKLRWVLFSPAGEVVWIQKQQWQENVLGDSFAAKVQAQNQLLARLSQQIAEKIRDYQPAG